jgi:hypothetical protein
VPVEETLLSISPAITMMAGAALFHLRTKVLRRPVER